jgi:hypothetical protein
VQNEIERKYAYIFKNATREKNNYHEKQFQQPYRSTVLFCDWLVSLNLLNKDIRSEIGDICAGKGANIFYMAKRFVNSNFTGIEINPEFVKQGNAYFAAQRQKRCRLLEDDLYRLNEMHIGRYEGIVSYQSLKCLPDYKTPIEKMIALNPKWIAITSLFFEGNYNARISVQHISQPQDDGYFYNVYSIPAIKKLFEMHGYSNFLYIPFEIDIDIPKPDTTDMKTYTERLLNGKRIQISGPLLMNWYFIAAKKPG